MFTLGQEITEVDVEDLSSPFVASQLKFLVMNTYVNYNDLKFKLHILGYPAMQFQQSKNCVRLNDGNLLIEWSFRGAIIL